MSSGEMGYENQQGSSSSSTVPWKIYTTSDVDPAYSSWKTGDTSSSSSTSMNAVSFGFVATAILIALFLIMAILEHLFRPTPAPTTTTPPLDNQSNNTNSIQSSSKFTLPHQNETTSYVGGVSVVMPGERYPSCIAKLAPLPCSPKRGLRCSSATYNLNQHTFAFSYLPTST